MDEAYTLVWEDNAEVVENEEIICDIDNDCTILEEPNEFTNACEEVVIQANHDNDLENNVPSELRNNIMYVTEDDMMVIQQSSGAHYENEHFIEISNEEVVTETWNEACPEIIVGSEENIEDQPSDEIEIPLSTDQDQYTARPFPCDFCSRRFRKKGNLVNHMVAHQSQAPLTCNLCGVRYIRKCDLMIHLKTHAYSPETDGLDEDYQTTNDIDFERPKPFSKRNKNKIQIKEEIDDRIESSSNSFNYATEDIKFLDLGNTPNYLVEENHPVQEPRFSISDPRKPFVCQHCGVGFAREKALASHARVHGGDSPFECRTCEEVFWDVSLLREHVRIKHGGIEQTYDEEDDDMDDADYLGDEDSKYGQFFCPTCGMSFHRQDNMKRHQRIHVHEDLNKDVGYGHVCNVCGESFPEALELLAHAEIHARGWEHRCMICGELFVDDQAVADHVQLKHGKNLPPNTCLMCGRTCKDRRTLLKHSFEHSQERLFGCSKCDKTFHNKARLKRHMISHRNKAVTCEECGADFPDGRSLMNHRHSHSGVTGRHFPCMECGKTFGSRSSQQIHIRIHTGERPYGCRYCWKAFADGGTLRKHERIHTGEKPYACAVCPRAFNQRVVLREHIRSHHSGPDPNFSHSMTPFSCAVCSDLFATSQDLIIHLIHHCDLNTAMKRQPQVGPRKYKRRRKLKPHELQLMSSRGTENIQEDGLTESDDENDYKRKSIRKPKKTPPKVPNIEESYTDVYNSFTSAIENINSIVNSKPNKVKRKIKVEPQIVPSRPKMIHTQKTRVPVETSDGGKVRHRTKTLVTHTQPTELRSATGERIRPRTKNVSYHVLQSEKYPLATFPEDDTEQAVNNLIASDLGLKTEEEHFYTNGIDNISPDIACEQIVETEESEPVNTVKVSSSKDIKKKTYSLRPGRTIIGPGSKVVRLVKGGMIVTKNKKIKEEPEADNILDNTISEIPIIKQEVCFDSGPLHELAELSLQRAQNIFKCEMCSEVFSDRDQLLIHVPIHI